MEIVQYGDLQVDELSEGTLITHARSPLAFTIALDCPFYIEGLSMYSDRDGYPATIYAGQAFERDEILTALYSLEVIAIEFDECLALNAWWVSRQLSLLERLARIAENSQGLETYLEKVKLKYGGIYYHASLMRRPKFIRNGRTYPICSELLEKISKALADYSA